MNIRNPFRFISLPLAASLIMNVVLVATVLVRRQDAPVTSLPPPSSRTTVVIEHEPPASSTSKKAAFHWRQLDAPDFPTFVKNLRAAGCPEATIHDIIQGELREIYEAKRRDAHESFASVPVTSGNNLEQRLRQLQTEENALLAGLVGNGQHEITASRPQASSADAAVVASKRSDTALMSAAFIPAAFQAGNTLGHPAPTDTLPMTPTDPNLDSATAEVLTQLRADFATSLAGATKDLDPSSLLYRQRWLSAQRESDERYSSLFGGDAFIHMQIESVRAAAQTTAPASK